ncbi:Outer membrane lipoprotein omp16 precursor [Candidatus Burkholderia humilis]|nr:Outer membrane lipoprotein omp16 precursor [Candidatus Burkholderia humilis]
MNTKLMTRLSVFVVAGALLAGCQTQQGTNTAVGAGAAAGGIVGYNWQAIRNKISGDSKGTGTQVTEQQDGSLKVNIPNSISFDTNSYAIKPTFDPVLNSVTQTMQQHPELIASVVGHTDNTGQPAYNQTLSHIATHGVPAQRLSASGMGPEPADRGQLDGSGPRAKSPRGNLSACDSAAGSSAVND